MKYGKLADGGFHTASQAAHPRPEANITFHLGGFDITGIEQSRESAKRRSPLGSLYRGLGGC